MPWEIPKNEHCGLHSLRSTLARTMLESGAPLPVISEVLGHESVQTTSIYLKINIDALRKCAIYSEGVGFSVKAEYLWKSRIAGHLTQFLDTMRLAGYKYEIQERRLRQFDQDRFDHEVPAAALPREAVEDFCYGDEYESQETRQVRLCLLRKLAECMEKSGCRVYMPPMYEKPFRYPKHQPYIYTEKESKRDLHPR